MANQAAQTADGPMTMNNIGTDQWPGMQRTLSQTRQTFIASDGD